MSKLARNHRNTELGLIHIGKKALNMTDEDYRTMLWTQGRVESASKLDFAGRKKVIDHMMALGFLPTGARGVKRAVKSPLTAPQKLIWSLWQQLADVGAVNDRKMGAVMAFVTRQTGVERLEWLNGAQENLVIESLKSWLGRPEFAEQLKALRRAPAVRAPRRAAR